MNQPSQYHRKKSTDHPLNVRRGLECLALLALLSLLIFAAIAGNVRAQGPAGTGKSIPPGGAKTAVEPTPGIEITGLVRQPLRLDLRDLRAFESVTERRVDHRTNGFFGDYECRGVPLAKLISLAGPRKKSSGFMRPTDLVVIVRNDAGQRVLFSYGELLFRSPSDVILAFEVEPVMPRRSCDSCHTNRADHAWRAVLNRKPQLPRLVASRDLDADRSLEGVTGIEIAELLPSALAPDSKGKSSSKPSQAIEIWNGSALLSTLRSLDSYPRHSVRAVEVGDAMGFHGEVRCEGAMFADVLVAAKAPSGPGVGYIVSAVDGYRMSLSSAELFSPVQPPPILIVDRCNGKPLGEQGAFKAIAANDTIAERWVKSVASIHVVRAAP